MPPDGFDGNSFQFLADDRRPWTAWLQNVYNRGGVLILDTTTDPDFYFVLQGGGGDHEDDHITYVTPDGSIWSSKCHSHTDGLTGNINFTFEHTPMSDIGAPHEDTTLNVVSWDSKSKWISVPDVGPLAPMQQATVNVVVTDGNEPVRE
jgi:hypothetical protein